MTRASAVVGAVLAVVALCTLSPPVAAATVPEDSQQWDCRVNGNRICGAGNDQDVLPGRYWDCGAGLCRADQLPAGLCRAVWNERVFPAVAVSRVMGGR